MLNKIKEILESIPGFEEKVAYRAFPVGNAPKLPFICYLQTGTNNFFADNKVYRTAREIDIELYSRNRDEVSEELIEKALEDNNITWTKGIEYLDDEKVYEVIYSVEV